MSGISRRQCLHAGLVGLISAVSGCRNLRSRRDWRASLPSSIVAGLTAEHVIAVAGQEVYYLSKADGSETASFQMDVSSVAGVWETTGYAATESGVVAFTEEGVLWSTEIEGAGPPRATVSRDSVYAARADGLVALDRQTGETRWRHTLPEPVTGRPVPGGGTLFVPVEGGVRALGPDRSTVWTTDLRGAPKLTVGPERVYAVSDGIFALAREKGAELWTLGGWVEDTPVLRGETVFTGGNRLGVYAIDARSGDPLWSTPSDDEDAATFTPPVLVGGTALTLGYGPLESELLAIDTVSGEIQWREALEDAQRSSPRADSSRVYVGDSGGVRAFSL